MVETTKMTTVNIIEHLDGWRQAICNTCGHVTAKFGRHADPEAMLAGHDQVEPGWSAHNPDTELVGGWIIQIPASSRKNRPNGGWGPEWSIDGGGEHISAIAGSTTMASGQPYETETEAEYWAATVGGSPVYVTHGVSAGSLRFPLDAAYWQSRHAEAIRRVGSDPHPDTPVGTVEIAHLLNVERQTVDNWRQRHPDFPSPDFPVGGRPAWSWGTIVAWADRTERLPSR